MSIFNAFYGYSYTVVMLAQRNPCFFSLFAGLTSAAWPSMLLLELILLLMFFTSLPVAVRHMPAHALATAAVAIVCTHFKSATYLEDPYLLSDAGQRQVAVLALFGGVLADAAHTVRCGFASLAMTGFLKSPLR
jgi:hypothetical protein